MEDHKRDNEHAVVGSDKKTLRKFAKENFEKGGSLSSREGSFSIFSNYTLFSISVL